MSSEGLDPLELELRLIPGVVAVGIEDGERELIVHLYVDTDEDLGDLRRRASQIGRSHLDGAIFIEIEGLGTGEPPPVGPPASPGRVALLAVRIEVDEIEVHLAYGGSRSVGRGPAAHPSGAAVATLDALEGLGARLAFEVRAVAMLSTAPDEPALAVVVLRPAGADGDRIGGARAKRPEESVCRATLHALNRQLTFQPSIGV